ncbi:MAG: hypothetical protein HY553_02530 [Elusimicrobia bacterium]|nr:hypothetical protein [Elusimicrobiota bacterium]
MRHSLAFLLLCCGPAEAAPIKREEVPAPLAPWVDWVLAGHETWLCPSLVTHEARTCVWPGVLKLDLSENGGRFEQQVRLYAPAWVALPGETGKWPQEVRVDGAPAAVVARGEAPAVKLKAGPHSISGSFSWDSTPELLRVPAETGVLAVTAGGKPVPFPVRDEAGRLWLQRSQGAAPEAAGLEISVHRRLIDEVPLELETQVQLRVSGKNREVVLGRALPKGFVPMSLVSPLPAKVDPDGRLRVQVRAGTWTLSLGARHEGPFVQLKREEAGGAWDPDEVWVFEAKNHLRVVTVEGAPAVDPKQTRLPGEWRRLPAYLMREGTAMKLVERRRGDQDPEPDRLQLDRAYWLDFDGRGLTVQDSVQGSLRRSWRLEMGPETSLGRVAVGGQDQFITAVKPGAPAGIEVRDGMVALTADSRIEDRGWTVPAVSWLHDFDRVSSRLNLPPGWRLVHISGVDAAGPTWVKTWTLLDLFLVLVLAAAVSRLWGFGWGVAALAAAGLAWHEPGAPRWLWLWAVAAEALVRALSVEGSAGTWVRRLRAVVLAGLAIALVKFSVTQVRHGMYPQLDAPFHGRGGGAYKGLGFAGGAAFNQIQGMVSGAAQGVASADLDEGAVDEPAFEPGSQLEEAAKSERAVPRAPRSGRRRAKANAPMKYAQAKNMLLIDPNSIVSTGPGLPDWSWRTVSLSWRGPVDSEQRLRLWLIGPCGNLFLAFLRVALAGVLALLVAGLPVGDWLGRFRRPGELLAAARTLLGAALLSLVPASVAAQSPVPPREILDELRSRLLERPDCLPGCAELTRAALEGGPGELRLRLEAHAAVPAGVAVPGDPKEWLPARAWVDGAPAGVHRTPEGTLYVAVPAGAHQVLLEGPLPARDSIQLSFPFRPRRVRGRVAGWTVHGILEDGAAEQTLQLTKEAGGKTPAGPADTGEFPAFVRVERTLRLGLNWEVRSRVVRLTPAGTPVSLQVPLIPGESVTTADLRAAGGKLSLTLPPQATELEWTSTLSETRTLALKAPESAPWVESWRLEASPIWHAEAKGIPPVHHEPSGGERAREWRPWPGESVELAFERPKGVPGRSLTLDRAELGVSPGLRATDVTLTLVARASRGGTHPVALPEGAELLTAKIDGRVEPVRQEGRRVVLQLEPGAHNAELTWRQPGGTGLLLRTPEVDAGASSVNARIRLSMPADRWTLLAGGPRLGPAVLFWSLLAVFFLVSAGLGRSGWAPLSWREWFLLSLGMTQSSLVAAGLVVAWFLAMDLRGRRPFERARDFDAYQLFLAFLTLVAAVSLFDAIRHGLLGMPDMQIAGNHSYGSQLEWYQDRSGSTLPRAWVFSVPLWVYRLAMLAWALWLAGSLVRWARWAWTSFANQGLWKPLRPKIEPAG